KYRNGNFVVSSSLVVWITFFLILILFSPLLAACSCLIAIVLAYKLGLPWIEVIEKKDRRKFMRWVNKEAKKSFPPRSVEDILDDDLIQKAATIASRQPVSASILQRELHNGYARAARIMDKLSDLNMKYERPGNVRL